MSYFKNLIELSRTKVPLLIEQVEWDGILFYMGGSNWNYNSSSDWVLIKDGVMVIGCHDDNVKEFIDREIIGKTVIEIQHSVDSPAYDPIFILKDGIVMKFFSTSIIDPWTLNFKDHSMRFVASPSDKAWVIST